MAARWASFVIWAAVVAGAVFWCLRLLVPSTAQPAYTVTVSSVSEAHGELTRVLGADLPPATGPGAPEPQAESRFQLLGVVAPRAPAAWAEGVALIAVGDKPPKAFRVGAAVEGDTVLQSVSARGAALGPRGGAATVSLATPPLAPPATGVLPPALSGPAVPPPAALARPMPGPIRPPVPVSAMPNAPALTPVVPVMQPQGEESPSERQPEGAATR